MFELIQDKFGLTYAIIFICMALTGSLFSLWALLSKFRRISSLHVLIGTLGLGGSVPAILDRIAIYLNQSGGLNPFIWVACYVILFVFGMRSFILNCKITIPPGYFGVLYLGPSIDLIKEGPFWKWPWKTVYLMDARPFTVTAEVKDTPNKEGAKIKAQALVLCQIGLDDEARKMAFENFVGRSTETMQMVIRQILEAHLRIVIGKLSVTELIQNHNGHEPGLMESRIQDQAFQHLARMGIHVRTLLITRVIDLKG